jgi:myo-inositol catabolism protein IolC
LEGYDTPAGADVVLAAVAAERKHPAVCIVLGRDAPIDRVERWLKVGAAKRFVGFAVGRTIWEEPLGRYLGGAISSEELVDIVADNYSTLVDAYIGA